MAPPAPHLLPSSKRKDALALISAIAICAQWLALGHLGLNLPAPWQPILPGIAVFGAAFLLSWAAELAQFEIPQSLALVMVALVAVLPEYAVDMYFAWTAGKDPSYIAYAAANMTGGNRLLIGVGWAAVIFAYWFKTRHKSISLDPGHRLELAALIAATCYSFVIPLKRTLSWIDSVFLLSIFAVYLYSAARAPASEPELEEGPAAWLAKQPVNPRRAWTIGLFLLAAWTIFKAAHPFAEGLLASGRKLGVEEFLLVQWLAPLASESPEFIVAILFALRLKPGAGMGTLISSKVNQWTLLIGMIPLAYAVSGHSIHPMQLDARQAEEILLTSAQSIFAIVILCDLKFSLWEGTLTFLLFTTQLFFTHPSARYACAGVYIALALGVLIFKSAYRRAFLTTLRDGWRRLPTPTT